MQDVCPDLGPDTWLIVLAKSCHQSKHTTTRFSTSQNMPHKFCLSNPYLTKNVHEKTN